MISIVDPHPQVMIISISPWLYGILHGAAFGRMFHTQRYYPICKHRSAMPLEFWEPLCRGGHHTIHTTPITLNASLCPVPFESPMGVSGLIDLHIGNNGGGRYHDKSNITTQYGDNATLSIICHLYRLISMMYIDSALVQFLISISIIAIESEQSIIDRKSIDMIHTWFYFISRKRYDWFLWQKLLKS